MLGWEYDIFLVWERTKLKKIQVDIVVRYDTMELYIF
jgi:hypothetical protein